MSKLLAIFELICSVALWILCGILLWILPDELAKISNPIAIILTGIVVFLALAGTALLTFVTYQDLKEWRNKVAT